MYKRIVCMLISLCMSTAVFAQETGNIGEIIKTEITAEETVENQSDESEEDVEIKAETDTEDEEKGESYINEKNTEDNQTENEEDEVNEITVVENKSEKSQSDELPNITLQVKDAPTTNYEAAKEIDLSATVAYMQKNTNQFITVNLLDEKHNVLAIDRKSEYLSYESLSPDIVEVSNSGSTKGRMQGKKYGSSTIVVTYSNGDKKLTKKMIATCYESERTPYSTSYGDTVTDPFGYTNQTVYKKVNNQVAVSPYTEAFSIWFFDDLQCEGRMVYIPAGYPIYLRASKYNPNYYITNENKPEAFSFESVEYARSYGWHQAAGVCYIDTEDDEKWVLKMYLDGNLMLAATVRESGLNYLTGMEAAMFKGDFTMLTNKWTYTGETKNTIEARAGNITAPSKGTIAPTGQDGKTTALTFKSEYPIDSVSAAKKIKLKKGSATQIAGGGGTEVEANVEVDGKTITVTPKFPLEYNTNYAIKVEQSLMSPGVDLARPMMLANAYTISFKTSEDDVTVSDITLTDKTYSFNIKNNTSGTVSIYAVMSTFDSDGKIIETVSKKISMTDQTPVPESIAVTENFANAEIYFWNSVNSEKIKSYDRKLMNTKSAGNAVTPSTSSFVNVTLKDAVNTLYVGGFNQRKMQGVPVTVRIVKPVADFSDEYKDYKTATDSNFNDIYYRCEEILTNADGSFSYSFKMDGLNGLYQIIVNMPDGEAFVKEFNYTDINIINDAMARLKGSDETTIESNFAFAQNRLGLIDKRFNNLANKQFVYNFMLSKITSLGDQFTLEAARSAFEVALEYAYNAENPTGLKEWLAQDANEWPLKDTAVHNAFMNMSDAKVALVANYLKSSATLQQFADNFKQGVIMTELKTIGNKNIVLTTFAQFPETAIVDKSDYEQLTDTGKDNVNTTFLQQVKSKNTVSEAIALYEYLAQEELRIQNITNSSSDGGHFDGNGGGSYVPSPRPDETIFETPPSTMPEETPDWYVDSSTVDVFSDLTSAEWAKEFINALYAQGIISGVGDGKFAPNNNVKREEIAKMIVVALNLEETQGEIPKFRDVDENSWYYNYVKIAYQHGIIDGIGDNLFGVGEPATREAVATMICRAAEAKGIYLDDVITIYPFDDKDSISEWAVESVEILRESMIINGMYANMFVPKNNITRAETAKLIYGLLQYK